MYALRMDELGPLAEPAEDDDGPLPILFSGTSMTSARLSPFELLTKLLLVLLSKAF